MRDIEKLIQKKKKLIQKRKRIEVDLRRLNFKISLKRHDLEYLKIAYFIAVARILKNSVDL